MAYDWSGNEVKQQRYDLVIVAALLTILSVVIVTPFVLRLESPATVKTRIDVQAPVAVATQKPIQLART